jgi:hypothetical protein
MYTQGVADYEKMAASPEFRAGLTRLLRERSSIMSRQCAPKPIRSTAIDACWWPAL